MKTQKCQDCKQYYPEDFIARHKNYCLKQKSYEECSFCKSVIEKKKFRKHRNDCRKNPKNIHFRKETERIEQKLSQIEIKHNPFPSQKINNKKCHICNEHFPMYSSNICYQCKDK